MSRSKKIGIPRPACRCLKTPKSGQNPPDVEQTLHFSPPGTVSPITIGNGGRDGESGRETGVFRRGLGPDKPLRLCYCVTGDPDCDISHPCLVPATVDVPLALSNFGRDGGDGAVEWVTRGYLLDPDDPSTLIGPLAVAVGSSWRTREPNHLNVKERYCASQSLSSTRRQARSTIYPSWVRSLASPHAKAFASVSGIVRRRKISRAEAQCQIINIIDPFIHSNFSPPFRRARSSHLRAFHAEKMLPRNKEHIQLDQRVRDWGSLSSQCKCMRWATNTLELEEPKYS